MKSAPWGTALLRRTLTGAELELPDVLWGALHTGDPGASGDQRVHEATYTGYKRIALPVNGRSWIITNNDKAAIATLREKQDFGECTAGTGLLTHFSLGTKSEGKGLLLMHGALLEPIKVYAGRIPRLLPQTQIVEH